jgi:hypothetical protein
MISAEEKVFSIHELRLIIISYYLKHPDESPNLNCYQQFKQDIWKKTELLKYKFDILCYRCINGILNICN